MKHRKSSSCRADEGHTRKLSILAALVASTLLAGPAPAQVVINEIMQNPSAVLDSDGEWLELYNPGPNAVDVDGWTVKDEGSDSFVISNGAPLLVPAGGYLVLGVNADPATNGGVTVHYQYQYQTDMNLANSSDEVVLLDGLTEIDRVEWDDGATFPDPNGESMELAKDPGIDNNVGSNWCDGYLLFGDGDRGTPGEANSCCFSEACMYLEVDISTRQAARMTLHQAIDDHVRFPYSSTGTDTWDILELADEDPANPTRILDLYKNASYPKAGGGNNDYDREHSWPASYGFPDAFDVYGESPFTDCHHLFLADKIYNEQGRSNNPYRDCVDPACEEWPTDFNDGQGGPGESNWKLGLGPTGTWETWPGRRGDVARAILYMDLRYEGGSHGATGDAEPDLIATDNAGAIAVTGGNAPVAYMGLLSDLLAWHEQDPPDALELWRNEMVFQHQRNRNPFIDHPEWVSCVYTQDCGVTQECVASDTTLCLPAGSDRFAVSVHFETVQGGGNMGDARAIPLDALGITQGGIFYFNDPGNPEFLVKILDGCGVNGHFWVFYAATTNVGFELTVRDTSTNTTRVYTNPDVHAADTITDTRAFATCP